MKIICLENGSVWLLTAMVNCQENLIAGFSRRVQFCEPKHLQLPMTWHCYSIKMYYLTAQKKLLCLV